MKTNYVELLGDLAYDVKIMSSSKGSEYARIKLNVKREGKGGFDNVEIMLFNENVDVVRNCKKGQLISAIGSVSSGSYEKNGQKIYTTSIIANEVKLVEREVEETFKVEEEVPKFVDEDLPF